MDQRDYERCATKRALTQSWEFEMANRQRGDPYKNFNFRTVFGAVAMAGLAGTIAARLLRAFKSGKGTAEETPAGARPIEGVGTSTAGFVGVKPKRAKRSPARTGRASRQRKAPNPRRRST
jgi:hypothetical protein